MFQELGKGREGKSGKTRRKKLSTYPNSMTQSQAISHLIFFPFLFPWCGSGRNEIKSAGGGGKPHSVSIYLSTNRK